MFEVYFISYRGERDEEPEMVFDSWDEAEEYAVEQMDRNCAPDEEYRIYDVEAGKWY